MEYIKSVPLWVYIVLLGFITFYTHEITIASDMGWYMNSGLNIFLGKGFTNMDGSLVVDRGPIFPLMIAASYFLLGVSPWSAFWVIRIFCIANPLVIYFFGKKLYGKWVGFYAALFILTSYSMNFWSYRHLDAVWPFIVTLGLYFTLSGFDKKELKYFLFSGICLGISILIKEVSVIFLCVPILIVLFIGEYRKIYFAKGVVLNLCSAIIILIPWLYYLSVHNSLNLFIGEGGQIVGRELGGFLYLQGASDFGGSVDRTLLLLKRFISGLSGYYLDGRHSLASNFGIAPLFLFGWIFILVRSFQGDKWSKILFLCAVPMFPVLSVVGRKDWRVGQGIFFLCLSYLALSALIVWSGKRLSGYGWRGLQASSFLCFCVLVCILGVQVFGFGKRDLGYKESFKNSMMYEVFTEGKIEKKISGAFSNANLNKTIEKLTKIVTTGEGVLIDWWYGGMVVYLRFAGANSVFPMPFLWCGIDAIRSGQLPTSGDEKAFYIDSNNLALNPRFMIVMLFESQLSELLEKENIKYVILTPRNILLSSYFASSCCFDEVELIRSDKNKNDVYRIYRVLRLEESYEFSLPIIGQNLPRAMALLRLKDRDKYENLKNKYFYKIASLTPVEFAQIEREFD